MQGNRPVPASSQHRGEGEGALPEDLNIGFSGKGTGIYAPFSAQNQTRSSYLGQPGEMEGEGAATRQVYCCSSMCCCSVKIENMLALKRSDTVNGWHGWSLSLAGCAHLPLAPAHTMQ